MKYASSISILQARYCLLYVGFLSFCLHEQKKNNLFIEMITAQKFCRMFRIYSKHISFQWGSVIALAALVCAGCRRWISVRRFTIKLHLISQLVYFILKLRSKMKVSKTLESDRLFRLGFSEKGIHCSVLTLLSSTVPLHCCSEIWSYGTGTNSRVWRWTAGRVGRRVGQKYTSPYKPTTKETRRNLRVHLGVSHPCVGCIGKD